MAGIKICVSVLIVCVYIFNLTYIALIQVSKAVPAACVGVNHLHTHRPWLQKTGEQTMNNMCKFVLYNMALNLKVNEGHSNAFAVLVSCCAHC